MLEVANNSVQKLREMSDAKHFCHTTTQPKMLALLKTSFIECVASSGMALRDRILSMDDGFEYLLKNRSNSASLEGLSKMFDLCTGRVFSTTYETDPDFVMKLAEVRLHYVYVRSILAECLLRDVNRVARCACLHTALRCQVVVVALDLTLLPSAFLVISVGEIKSRYRYFRPFHSDKSESWLF